MPEEIAYFGCAVTSLKLRYFPENYSYFFKSKILLTHKLLNGFEQTF